MINQVVPSAGRKGVLNGLHNMFMAERPILNRIHLLNKKFTMLVIVFWFCTLGKWN